MIWSHSLWWTNQVGSILAKHHGLGEILSLVKQANVARSQHSFVRKSLLGQTLRLATIVCDSATIGIDRDGSV